MSPKTAKKGQSKKYTGARRRHILRDGNSAANGGLGQNCGPGPDFGNDFRGPSNARKEGAVGGKSGISEGVNGPS
ncbi:hypothetical protein PIB30_115876, partial [Stylosanthes scabra]|nr:hypothetical protein [Stylosanthes scabra]